MTNEQQEALSLSTKRLILAEYIHKRTEVDFMKEVLVPLFERMQFETIYNHGRDEIGKDFVLKKKNDFGEEEITAVVVKNGNIGGAKGDAKLDEVKRQVEQSLQTDLSEFGLKGRVPNRVLVFAPGRISSTARRELTQSQNILSSTKVSFFWDEKLITLIDKFYPFLFQVRLPATARYLADLIEYIETITTIDPGFSALLNLANLKCIRETKSTFDSSSGRETQNPEDVPQSGGFSWIQGGTGSGKTFTVYRIAQRSLNTLKSDAVKTKTTKSSDIQIPIYIKSSSLTFDPKDFSLENFLLEQVRTYSTACSRSDIEEWLKDFNTVLIFDEYEFKTPRIQLNAITKEILTYPRSSILVLSRILSDTQLKFDRVPELWQMRELNLATARKVLHSCLPSENKKSIQLYNDMLGNGVLERVPRTPLALNVLSQVFSGNVNSTPVNMFEFFDMFFELVLGRWEPRRDLDSPLDYNQVRGFLEEVAYEMIQNSRLSYPVMMLLPAAERVLNSTRNTSISPLEFIESVAKYGEVAVIKDNEFSFTQRTFMEFLAGCEFEQHHWDKNFILDKITDINWEDALLFAAGSKKKNDELLADIEKIREGNSTELFFKTKNIAGLTLALYRSDTHIKQNAIRVGLQTAVKLRDNEGFDASIKHAFKDDRDLIVSLVGLSLFSTFYGKTGLIDCLKQSLKETDSDREKFYALAALLETMTTSAELTPLLTFVPQDVATKEALAFGPYIQVEAKQSENSEPIKSLLKEKEIKKVTEKAIEVLRQQNREQNRYFPNR